VLGRFTILFFFLISSFVVFTQENLSNLHQKELLIQSDTIILDTLSIVPQSVFIYEFPTAFTDSLLYIDYAKALLIIKNKSKLYNKRELPLKISCFSI